MGEPDEYEAEGYNSVVEIDGDDYHVVGLSEGDEEWIDYSCPVDDVPEVQRDDVNLLMGDREVDGADYLEGDER